MPRAGFEDFNVGTVEPAVDVSQRWFGQERGDQHRRMRHPPNEAAYDHPRQAHGFGPVAQTFPPGLRRAVIRSVAIVGVGQEVSAARLQELNAALARALDLPAPRG